jgi:hypothetical protein
VQPRHPPQQAGTYGRFARCERSPTAENPCPMEFQRSAETSEFPLGMIVPSRQSQEPH